MAGPQAPAALLPLIDMANHSFKPNCEVLPVPGGVAMVAKRPVRDTQLCVCRRLVLLFWDLVLCPTVLCASHSAVKARHSMARLTERAAGDMAAIILSHAYGCC